MRNRVTVMLVALLIAPALSRAAPDSSALINEALDQPVDLTLNTVLPKAMSTIADKTGVKIDADPAVWDLLPWGEQTNIKVELKNQTLRAGLEAVAKHLGLVMVLKAQAVELQPMAPLRRLGRRATDKELEALYLLSTTPLDNLGGKDKPTVEQLVEAVDGKLQQVRPEFSVEFRGHDQVKPTQAAFVARNATMYDALEAMARETPATWYPWGKSVVVLPREMQIRANNLGKTVTVRYSGVDIAQVLLELEKAAGVDFEIEAGAIQRIPPESRNVTLILDATVQQALEAISGVTGLDYVVKGDGVYIWNPSAAGAGGAAQDPVLGMIQLDNGVQIMLRRSTVPPDVQQYIDHRREKAIEALREMMKDENFKPTTQPTTRPTANPG